MMKIFSTLLLLLIVQSISAQKQTVTSVDVTTYKQYLNSNWDSLIITGKEALHNEIDFYYLQVRLGVSYYNLKNYRKAIVHFKNAFEASPTDGFVRRYLYYSYLFAGQKSDAVIFSKRLTVDMRKQLGIKDRKFIEGVQSEYGYFFNKDHDALINTDNFDDNYLYAEQSVPENYKYFTIGLSHAFKNGTTFNHSYTNLKIDKTQQYQVEPLQTLKAKRLPNSSSSSNNAYEYIYTTNQNQYYASFGFHPKVGLSIIPAIHFLNTKSTYFEIDYDGTQTPSVQSLNYSTNEFVAYLGVAKECGLFTVGTSVSYSNLNNKNQLQPGVSLIYYPLGNLNLYTASYLYYQSNGDSFEKEKGVIFNQKVGFKLSKVWLEGIATFGNFSEFNESAGFVVYNSIDKIQSRYEAAVIIPTNEGKFNFSLRYQNLKYQGQISHTKDNNEFDYSTFIYTNHLFIGGISWNF